MTRRRASSPFTGPGRVMPAMLACLVAVPAVARAQEGALVVDAGASWSLPPGGSVAESTPHVNLGVRLEGPLGGAGWAFLAGSGGLAASDSGASWVSALGGIGTALPLGGPAFLDLSATGEAFSVGDPYTYRGVLGEGEAALRLGLGPTTARLAAWGGIGSSETEVLETFTRMTRWGTATYERGVVVAADLWSYGGRLEVARSFGRWQPWAGLEAYDAPQGGYYGGRAGVRYGAAGIAWDVEAGAWDTPYGTEAFLTARVRVPVGRGLATRVSGGRYGPDPLLDLEPAGAAGALLSWTAARFGDAGARAPFEAPGAEPGTIRFTLEAPGAESVALAGGFTEWEEVPMRREGDGWALTLPVEPGVHRYAFRVDGTWHVPETTPGRTEDEWGFPVATLVVPGP